MRRKALFITGTDTGVGKTVVSCALALLFRERGIDVGVMKPIATGVVKSKNRLISFDTEFLIKASQTKDEKGLITLYRSQLPLSAYDAFKNKISISRIIKSFKELENRHELLLVEGIGGLFVPIRRDYFVADLVRDLAIPIVVVSRNSLGTINHTLLTLKQAEYFGIEILGVIFNNLDTKKDLSKKTNPETICKLANVDNLGSIAFIKNLSVERQEFGDLLRQANKYIRLELIIKKLNKEDSSVLEAKALENLDKRYIWHPFTQMKDWLSQQPLIIKQARGSYLQDVKGRWFLDGVSSLWVNIHGHRKKELDLALKEQVDKVAHSTFLGLSHVPAIKLAKQLIDIAPKGLTKVFFSDDGSTSVEIALKMAFAYWQYRNYQEKTKFIYLNYSYHGDTIGSVSVGGIDLFHKIFRPLLFSSFKVEAPYCYRCPKEKVYPACRLQCLDSLKDTLERYHKQVCALIVEPIVQCAGGIIVWPQGILRQMRQLCDRYGILLIADEVAVGFGRTGKMFACEHEDVTPDIICLSKGLSAGYLPLAATLTKEDIYRQFLGNYSEKKTFFHGHSYTANPLACAVARESLEIFRKEDVLKRVKQKIEFLENQLKRFKELSCVGDIRQKGLIVGIELVKDKTTKQEFSWEDKIGIRVCEYVRTKGLILRPLGNVIVLMPPLSIELRDLKKITDITYDAIEHVTG